MCFFSTNKGETNQRNPRATRRATFKRRARKHRFRMMYYVCRGVAREKRIYFSPSSSSSPFSSRMHFAREMRYPTRAKGPFAPDSILIPPLSSSLLPSNDERCTLSSNTAYRDQFSGSARDLSQDARRQERKTKRSDDILFPRVIRASHAAANPLVYSRRIRRLWETFLSLFRLCSSATIFSATSKRTLPIKRFSLLLLLLLFFLLFLLLLLILLLFDVYLFLAPTISTRRSSRNYPPRGPLCLLGEMPDRSAVYRDLLYCWPPQRRRRRRRRCMTPRRTAVV